MRSFAVRKSQGLVLAGVIALGAGSGLLFVKHSKAPAKEAATVKPTVTKKTASSFIEKNETSKDKKVQTEVTRARIQLAYNAAAKKDYKEAREGFILASQKHEGSKAMHPEFGTLSDQAAYQAIVCLEADGQKDKAEKEYREFIKTRQTSPLVHMCHRRLERMHGGKSLESDDALLQAAISEQEKRIRFETSVCGPKCLEKLLTLTNKEKKDYKEIAKLAGTTDMGTTMEGLKKAAKDLGFEAVGLELNANDYRDLKKPAILLEGDHYVLITKIEGEKAHTFDPRYGVEQSRVLPKHDDPNFRVIVLAFELPQSELSAGTPQSTKPQATTPAASKKS